MSFMNWRLAIPLFACVALLGCEGAGPGFGGVPRKPAFPSVVSLSPGTSELAGRMGNGQSLVGRTSSCNWPDQVKTIPIVMRGTKPDYERIATIKPGVVVYDQTLFSEAEIAKVREMNIQAFAFGPKDLKEYEQQVMKMAALLGGESTMSEYLDTVMRERDRAKASVAGKTVRSLTLIGSTGEYLAPGKSSFLGNLLQDITGSYVGPEGDKYVPMNVESIVRANPTIIFTAGNQQRVLADPRLATVDAVKSRRVLDINSDLLLRVGGRVDILIKDGIAIGLTKIN